MTRRQILLLCVVGFAVAGCTVGPDYKRPEVSVPPVYRGADAGPQVASATSFGELAWWNVFQDPELQELIRTALVENYDLRVAVSRILQAQSQVTVARSQQFPTVDGSVNAPYSAIVGGSLGTASSPRAGSAPPGSWTSGESSAGTPSQPGLTCSPPRRSAMPSWRAWSLRSPNPT
jgi:multidrug efflux system outer membrane protein